jgi:hypothetical protein
MDVLWTLTGAVILTAGRLVSQGQTLARIQRKRRLTDDETALLQRVFRDSLALDGIRLVEGFTGLFRLLGTRPFTLGNTLILKKNYAADEPYLLIHECAHTWQYQRIGARYVSQALWAQRRLPDAYDWRAEIARGKEAWVDFNPESQAQLLQDVYVEGALAVDGRPPTSGDGVFYDADGAQAIGSFAFKGEDHTARANAAVATLRA